MIPNPKQQLLIWWILWGAFLAGLFVIYFTLGSISLQAFAASGTTTAWLAAAIPVFISVIIRWLILPRASTVPGALAVFVVGITMAEATCFLGIFLFPAHKLELFVLSVLGIFQYLPYFAGRHINS